MGLFRRKTQKDEEIEKAVDKRMRRRTKVIIIALVIVLAIGGVYLFQRFRTYSTYKVEETIPIKSGEGSKYVPFGKFVVKYSNNGIMYLDDEDVIWDEAYEMKTPIVDVRDDYLAVADKGTNDIYIYNEDGRKGKVTTNYPIIKIQVAKQGVTAAMSKNKRDNYIEVFDRRGKTLVSHKTLLNENGYPLNFAISDDGTKMAVSYVTVKAGTINSKVMFYNFAGAGQNEENKMVGSFDQYGESVVPEIDFVTNNRVVAVGENIISVYDMKTKPDLKDERKVEDDIQKVFLSSDYIGLIYKNSKGKMPYRLEAYSMGTRRVLNKDISMNFDNVSFAGKNILMYNNLNCQIISIHGVKKFDYIFKRPVSTILPWGGERSYLFMTNQAIQKVKLK